MNYVDTEIPDIKLLEPSVHGDERGFFMETWRDEEFRRQVGDYQFVQENHSKSSKNVLRGLHYQIDQAQGKLVRVVLGDVFDVAVDLRTSSATFGKWVGEILSCDNKRQLWVPPGFAHGFLVLSDTAEFVYKCTDYYAPEHERSILWNDTEIGIEWPLDPATQPLLSEKDSQAKTLSEAETYR